MPVLKAGDLEYHANGYYGMANFWCNGRRTGGPKVCKGTDRAQRRNMRFVRQHFLSAADLRKSGI